MSFQLYPEISSDRFYQDNYVKKEFFKTRFDINYLKRTPEEACSRSEFKLQNQQEFVRNFISPETPYNGILLFHGTGVGKTCGAISITEGLRDYIHKMGKKIWIISSENIRENFKNELYDMNKAEEEYNKHSPPGSYQCSGDRYHINFRDIPNTEQRMKKIEQNIKKYYEFKGAIEFANLIDVVYKKRQGLTNEQIAEKFIDSVIVIDEVHNIAGEGKNESRSRKKNVDQEEQQDQEDDMSQSGYMDYDEDYDIDEEHIKNKMKKRKTEISNRTLLHVLLDLISNCRKLNGNLKLILLTATPMKDKVTEVADLLELLNYNDGVKIDRNKLFLNKDHTEFSPSYLAQISRGYISYVRGNNPVSFPEARNPPAEFLYEPKPLFLHDKKFEPVTNEYDIIFDEEKNIKYEFNLYKCPMHLYQYVLYYNIAKYSNDSAHSSALQASDLIYPNEAINDIILGNHKITKDKINKYFKKDGFFRCFTELKIDVEDEETGKMRRDIQYEYKKEIIEKYGYFLMINNIINPKNNLNIFSRKYHEIINNINKINGISYVYGQFDVSGVGVFALALESNGFIKYDSRIMYDKNGLPMNIDTIKNARLLNLNPNIIVNTTNERILNYRCAICGELYNKCRELNTPIHNFKLATYLVISGKLGSKEDIQRMRDPRNKQGHIIKCLVGTKVTSEGIDLKWVRGVHITDPWFNNTRIYQTIGRGIRNCSHITLPPEERNVVVYKYSSTVPDVVFFINNNYVTLEELKKNLLLNTLLDQDATIVYNNAIGNPGLTFRDYLIETSNEYIYRMAITKDIPVKRIERILKRAAVDCELNKNANYFGKADIDYSRECDYARCKYSCLGYTNKIEYIDVEINFNIKKIKSRYAFEDNDWHNYLKSDNKKALNKILNYFNIEIDNNEDPTVFVNKLRSTLLHAGAYKESLNHLKFERPLVDVDISTYNIHFAQPQITKAQWYIAQLYHHSVALKEKDIINLVLKHDPLIGIEFIRSALDKLVGNPPNIEPLEIQDKYNRPGHLIYVNTYYVFQPDDIRDKKIPLYYRQYPLLEKKQYINMNDLSGKNIVRSNAVYTTTTAQILEMITQLSDIVSTKYNDDEEVNNIYITLKVRAMLDFTYILQDQEELLKYCIVLAAGDHQDKNIKIITDILVRYYIDLNLLHVYKDTFYSFFNYKNIYKFDERVNKWIRLNLDDNDDIILNYNKAKLRPLNTYTNGLYGYIADKATRVKTIYNNTTRTYSKLRDTLYNLNSYIKRPDDISNFNFKINDKTDEHKMTTFHGDESKRSIKIGLNCKQNINAAKEFIGKLEDIINSDAFKSQCKININEFLQSLELHSQTNCNKIIYILKLLDLYNYKNVKWFLSPFETEYYIPIKNRPELVIS